MKDRKSKAKKARPQFSRDNEKNEPCYGLTGSTGLTPGLTPFRCNVSNLSAIILNNDFSGITYGGIGDGFDYNTHSLGTAQVYGNKLGQGVTFNVQIPYQNGFGWFLGNNTYLNAYSNTVPPFLDPPGTSVHLN